MGTRRTCVPDRTPTAPAQLRSRTRIAATAAFVSVAVLLSGCVTSSGGTPGKLARAADQSLSAVKTSALSLELEQQGRSLPGVTSKALTDMLDRMKTARSSVVQLSVSDDRQQALRRNALAVFDQAVDAVLTAQDIDTMDVSPRQAAKALQQAQNRLEARKKEIGPAE